ncbi:MAG: hypothetical protein ACPL4K_05695, partial [Candidatus Margulisiibacteriota bacterium]
DLTKNLDDKGYMKLGLYLTTDPLVTLTATREHTGHAIYSNNSTGVNFKQSINFNDWLSFGVINRSKSGAAIDLSGSFTAMAKFTANFLNASINISNNLSASIDNLGYTTLTITPEVGRNYEKSLDQPLWSGFTQQSSTMPLTTLLEARNDLSISAPLTMVAAAKWKDLAVGLSLTPITANANINNNLRMVANENTPDLVFYQPNLNPADEQSILNWANDPNQYASEIGYRKNIVRVPAGEVIAEARYQGFYQANTTRLDLGATYDLGDFLTLGLVLENLGGASLDFRGSGRVAYVNSRIGTLESPSFDATQPLYWSPFRDTLKPVEGTENYFLEEQLSSELPKKIRYGIALRKPFLIAIDYEQNQTPIKFKWEDQNTKEIKIGSLSNFGFWRIGLETKVLFLPWWLRGSTILMTKPTATNVSAEVQSNIENYFKYGFIPLGFELGSEADFWGVLSGFSLGLNLSSIISLAQLDTLNLDLGKVIYYNIYSSYGPWTISYLASFDPGASAGAYSNRTDKNEGFGLSHVRYVQTLTLSYKF